MNAKPWSRIDQIVAAPLEELRPLPALLRAILSRSTCRLLDADRLVANVSYHRAAGAWPIPASYRIRSEVREELTAADELTSEMGLLHSLGPMMRAFSRIIASVFLDAGQTARARAESEKGGRMCFMMTDAGGQETQNWRSTWSPTTGIVRLDKRLIMVNPTSRNFGPAVVKRDSQIAPIIVFIEPVGAAKLAITPAGPPLLGGTLHLANIRGELMIGQDASPTRGGIGAPALILALVRPHLVRLLMTNAQWLHRAHRLRLNRDWRRVVTWLHDMAVVIAECETPTSATLRKVFALKLACNEVLLELVCTRCYTNDDDARDALAFTKMEGSSYRCFSELCARSEVRRD